MLCEVKRRKKSRTHIWWWRFQEN